MSATDESETQTMSVDNATLHAMTKAELDQSIATARAFPRDAVRAIKETATLATLTEDTADDCIFAVPRDGKTIEGPSVRLAEILNSRWGNCRAGARVIEEGREHITAQGVFHDLETNAAVTSEVRRRIVDRRGRRYSADMIGTTANAACSIALRNAVFKGIPKAIWNPAYLAARKCVAGDSKTLADRRAAMVGYVQKFGVTKEQLLAFLGKETVEEITGDDIARVRGLCSAIRDGETTAEEAFNLAPKPATADAPAAASAVDRAKELLTRPAPAAPEQKPPEAAPAEEPKKKPAAKPAPRTAPEKKPAVPDTVKTVSAEDEAEAKLQAVEAERDAAQRGLRGAKSQAIASARSEDADDVEETLSEIPLDPPADAGKVKPAAELSPEMKARYEADNPKEPTSGAGPLYGSADKAELIKAVTVLRKEKNLHLFNVLRLVKVHLGVVVGAVTDLTVPQLEQLVELLNDAPAAPAEGA